MKKYLAFLIFPIMVSCTSSKTGIVFDENAISILEKDFSFNGFVPLINQEEMKRTGSDLVEGNTIVHYIDLSGEKKMDLIFRIIKTDSLFYSHISARFPDNHEWGASDTLKVFFSKSDSITTGIYSILYGENYCWTKPVHFSDFKQIGNQHGIQFAYWKYSNNNYAFAMPLGGTGFAFCLGSEKKGFGAIGTIGYQSIPDSEIPVLSLSVSRDFYKLIPQSFKYSFKVMGIPDNLRIKKTKPDMYNYLGWATWNAFMHDINEEKILNAAKSLKASQIPVKWFLIDDGWLDITDNKLNSYIPDKKKFPGEFLPLTSKLKNEYGIKDIGVWHTLNGYWEGLNDSGKLKNNYKDIITYRDRIAWLSKTIKSFHFINPLSEEGFGFYDAWYKYLTSQGISFVKVDNQMVASKLAYGNSSLWETSEKEFRNLHSAVEKNFNSNVINCMSMTNTDFYHYSNTTIARTVEDYNPNNNEKLFSCEFNGNAAAHILASVHNSVWLSNIVWPDYDMFQSDTKDAWYYAIAKVMSNGPVYLSDEPGKHNSALLKSITFSDARIINADKPALPTEDCLFQLFESGKPFKVFSYFRNNGLLSSWNVSDKDSVTGSFSPSQIRPITGTQFVIFEYFSKSVFEAGLETEIPVRLNRTGCKFFSVIPVKYDKAVIGDINKIIPMAAVSNIAFSERTAQMNVEEPATIWIYSKVKPALVKINSKIDTAVAYENNIISVKVSDKSSTLEIEF